MYKEKNDITVLALWVLDFVNGEYYTSNTHYYYIQYLSKRFEKVCVITSVNDCETTCYVNSLKYFGNVHIIRLPYIKSFISSLPHVFAYFKAIKSVADNSTVIYCRVPDPFCWMPALFFKQKTIMHFVGDTIDATQYNEKWGLLKKIVMIMGYLPEYVLTLLAARKSKVYTNGYHLGKQLERWGIKSYPVISSIVFRNSLCDNLPEIGCGRKLNLIFVGFIRNAKGIHCLMDLWVELKKKSIDFLFRVVGDGEMFQEVQEFIENNDLGNNVILYGKIDDRIQINDLLKCSDLFVFASLSEGSPRVVIEAMGCGIPVISTPVGSLPTSFTDKINIRFFDFNKAGEALKIIEEFIVDKSSFVSQRENAYKLVKQYYTIEVFLSQIFKY